VLKLFLQIKQRQEEANDITQKKEEKLEKYKRYVSELKNLELKYAKEMEAISAERSTENRESLLLKVRAEDLSPEIQLME
jgi:hypothetical protein